MTVLLELNRSETQPQFPSCDGTRALAAMRDRLEPSWCILGARRVAAAGASYALDAIVLHPGYGIGLVAVGPAEFTAPELAIRTVRAFLLERGFDAGFPGYLPVVFVSVDPASPQEAPLRLAAAFAALPALGIADGRWIDAAADFFAAASLAEAEAAYDLHAEAAPDAPADRPNALLRPLIAASGIVALSFTGLTVATIALWPAPRDARRETEPDRVWAAPLLPKADASKIAAEAPALVVEPILASSEAFPTRAEPPLPGTGAPLAEAGSSVVETEPAPATIEPIAAPPEPIVAAEPAPPVEEPSVAAPEPIAVPTPAPTPKPRSAARSERRAASAAATHRPPFRGAVRDDGDGRHDPASAFLNGPVAIRLSEQLKGRMDLSLVRHFKSDDGLACREYRQSVTLEGQQRLSSAGTVCRQRSGRWMPVP